jgi:hypothetical protein
MTASARSKKTKARPGELARRLNALTGGLTVAKILRADESELVIEFADGTRLFVKAGPTLDISVT